MEEINPFESVSYPQSDTQQTAFVSGDQALSSLNSISIGSGSKVLHSDQSGLWMGADKFSSAPFSVDMQGNLIASSATFSNYLSKTGSAQSLSGSVNVGIGNVVIDGANKRILINDGTYDRILIGYLAGGF